MSEFLCRDLGFEDKEEYCLVLVIRWIMVGVTERVKIGLNRLIVNARKDPIMI